MAHRKSLLNRSGRAADQVLPLAFDPEMRRAVGQVGKNRDHRSFRARAGRVGVAQAFQDRVIEIRNHRDHRVRPRMPPMARQQLDHRRLELANQHLRDPQQRTSADGQAILELRVVEILDAHAGETPNHVGRLEQIAQVDRIDPPVAMLLLGCRYQRRRRRAMSTARVEIDQIQLCIRVSRRGFCHALTTCEVES